MAGCWPKLLGQTAAAKVNLEFPARPSKQAITPPQRVFWDYIEAFHRLPDYPTDLQNRIFATRGDAKPFQFIATSPTSVLANVAGIKAHRERFAQRYPWVKKLLENENITLDVDESVFQGSAMEIINKHDHKVDSTSGDYFQADGDRQLFTKRWLESLLVIDFCLRKQTRSKRCDGLAGADHDPGFLCWSGF